MIEAAPLVDVPRLPDDNNPAVKLFTTLCAADFRRHPVWVVCACVDEGQPWYDPRIYLPSGTAVAFWGGFLGVADCVRSQFYRELGRSSEDVFPIEFRVPAGILEDVPGATIHGFLRLESLQPTVVICEV